MRITLARIIVQLAVVAAAIAGLVSIADASEGVCSFTVAGHVEEIWCSRGPNPAPCHLLIQVPSTSEKVEIGVWCVDDVAEVCQMLERGMPVVVLGEDDGENKSATHVAIWLEPPANSSANGASEGRKER